MRVRHLVPLLLLAAPATAHAADMRVAAGGDIQAAIDQAMPGDVITLEAGTYDTGELRTARDGAANAPITLTGEGDVLLRLNTGDSRLFDVQHAYFRLEAVTLDAGFAPARVMRVDDGALGFTLRNAEVRNAALHCIDIRDTSDVTIEDSLIHHCLAWNGGREDAHGISAGAVRRLTIRNTEIHSFTGDALQVDPSRAAPGWNDVVVDGCTFWLAPITDGAGGVPNGVVPGENAIDTKTADGTVGTLTIRNTVAYGYRNGEIGNMAAFNLKEDVEVIVDAVTVFDSEIAFRIRGRDTHGAQPRLTNVVVYDVDTALRLEDALQATIPLHHVTFGRDIGQHVQTAGGASATILDPQNVVVLGPVPAELTGVAANEADFASAATDDYVPVAAAPWLDSGVDLGVDHDRRGAARPQGAGPDPGAYEFGDAPAADMGSPPADDMGSGANNNPGNNGTPDGGEPGPDQGTGPNGGPPGADPTTGEPGGCQCGTASNAGGAWGLVLLIVAAGRRSRPKRG